MNNLTIIEHQDQRVLTTAQVALGYGTEPKRISENFRSNQERYQEGVHYYQLTGKELADFKLTNTEIKESSRINKLYLWTEKGTFLHAKSLNTDRAWDVYNELVDTYFRVKNNSLQQMQQQFNLPSTFKEALQCLITSEEEKEKLQQEVEILKPKAEKHDIFLQAKNSQTMLEVAKSLDIGRNTLMKFLRMKKVFMSNNIPYERYRNLGLFKTREFSIVRKNGQVINCCQTFVTAKGIDYICNMLNELKYKNSLPLKQA